MLGRPLAGRKQLVLGQAVDTGSLILYLNELISPEHEVVVCRGGDRGSGMDVDFQSTGAGLEKIKK